MPGRPTAITTKLGSDQNNQDGLVLQPNFPTSFLLHLWCFPNQQGSKTTRSKIYDFWHLCRVSRPTPLPNLAYFKTNQDGLGLPPNFDSLIFIAFVVLFNQEGSKIGRSKIHDFWHLCLTSKPTHTTTKIGSIGNQPRWIGFSTKHCQPYFYCICGALNTKQHKNREVKIL